MREKYVGVIERCERSGEEVMGGMGEQAVVM